jgi:hypothetical protein
MRPSLLAEDGDGADADGAAGGIQLAAAMAQSSRVTAP